MSLLNNTNTGLRAVTQQWLDEKPRILSSSINQEGRVCVADDLKIFKDRKKPECPTAFGKIEGVFTIKDVDWETVWIPEETDGNVVISNCPKLQHIKCTRIICPESIKIVNCPNLIDVEISGNCKALTIDDCKKLVSIKGDIQAEKVTITNCAKISVAWSGHVDCKQLILQDLPKLISFEQIDFEKLEILRTGIQDLGDFRHLRISELTISGNPKLASLGKLPNIEGSVELFKNPLLTSLDELPEIISGGLWTKDNGKKFEKENLRSHVRGKLSLL